jgi:hypothetical protein
MGSCFVIQPFDDGGPFDKRYEDTFEPAIKAGGFEPYRVDRDRTVQVPIDEIHTQIRAAAVCLADVSTDNPNVWYELGYAFAAGKPVVMVCHTDRERFPFDIQHRHVVRYATESRRDWDALSGEITDRLRAAVRRDAELQSVAEASPLVEIQGLSQQEIVALVIIAEDTTAADDLLAAWNVSQSMERAGFTKIATRLATERLIKKQLIEAVAAESEHEQGGTYTAFRVLPKGLDWLDRNEDKLVLRKAGRNTEPRTAEDDIPF